MPVRVALLLAITAMVAAAQVDFTPPDAAARERAIGPLAELAPALRAALDPAGFEPMGPALEGDWLRAFAEQGQGWEQFRRERNARPDERRRTIYLRPIGVFDKGRSPPLERLRRWVEAYFMLPVAVMDPLDAPAGAFGERRNPHGGQRQLLTTELNAALQKDLPRDGFVAVGVTMVDLYPDPSWNFVFGSAQPPNHVGVFSFARHAPRGGTELNQAEQTLLLGRSCHVLSHEIGHLFGIEHCIWYRCVMDGSNSLAEADTHPLHACPVDLRKLQGAIGFDPLERYRGLAKLCVEFGLKDEKTWLDGEIARIEKAAKP